MTSMTEYSVSHRTRRRSSQAAMMTEGLRRSSRLSVGDGMDATPRTMIEAFQQDRPTTARRLRQPRRQSMSCSLTQTPASVRRANLSARRTQLRSESSLLTEHTPRGLIDSFLRREGRKEGTQRRSKSSLLTEPTPRGLIDSFLRRGEEQSLIAVPSNDDNSHEPSPVFSRPEPSRSQIVANDSVQDDSFALPPPSHVPSHRFYRRLRSRPAVTSQLQQKFVAALHEKLANIDKFAEQSSEALEEDVEFNGSQQNKTKDKSRLASSRHQSTDAVTSETAVEDVTDDTLPNITPLDSIRNKQQMIANRENIVSMKRHDGNDVGKIVSDTDDADGSHLDNDNSEEEKGRDAEKDKSTMVQDGKYIDEEEEEEESPITEEISREDPAEMEQPDDDEDQMDKEDAAEMEQPDYEDQMDKDDAAEMERPDDEDQMDKEDAAEMERPGDEDQMDKADAAEMERPDDEDQMDKEDAAEMERPDDEDQMDKADAAEMERPDDEDQMDKEDAENQEPAVDGDASEAEGINDVEEVTAVVTVGRDKEALERSAPWKNTSRPKSQSTLVTKMKRSTRRKRPQRARLPPGLTRSIFMHFSDRNLAKGTLDAIEKIADRFWENVTDDLTSYAKHAGRSAISEDDVELLMRRQGFVNSTETLYSLVETYLPYEYREEIIPIAISGNKIIPDK